MTLIATRDGGKWYFSKQNMLPVLQMLTALRLNQKIKSTVTQLLPLYMYLFYMQQSGMHVIVHILQHFTTITQHVANIDRRRS